MPKFDYVIIGGGQGGALARQLAEAGKRVALIEKKYVGGSCTNVGCTPTKAHIAAAKVAHVVRTSQELGVRSKIEIIDLPFIVERTRRIVEEFRQENEEQLMNTDGLDLVYGTARFASEGGIEVELRTGEIQRFTADKYIIAVGTTAQIPEVQGLKDISFLTHVEALQLEEIPPHLLILGGGYIACEFAQMFARFGSQVTIIQNKPQLLPHEDDDVAEGIADVLRRSGVEVIVGQEVDAVRGSHRGIEAVWSTEKRVFSHVLIATGQKPQTQNLSLEHADIQLNDSGHILTDEYLKTSHPHIYAMGDCRVGPAFTHIAYDDARILRDGLLQGKWRSIKERLVPYTVFTDPQLGRIGMSEEEAKKSGKEFEVVCLNMKDTARGVETEQTQGFWKVLVERGTGLILGGAFLSGEGGETMAVVEIAMQAKMPFTSLRDGIFAHPTWAEALNNLFLHG